MPNIHFKTAIHIMIGYYDVSGACFPQQCVHYSGLGAQRQRLGWLQLPQHDTTLVPALL